MDYQKYITIEPGKRGGKPCIRGMRVTVYEVLDYLVSGMTEAEILADFPDLTAKDLKACLAFAADRERKNWSRFLMKRKGSVSHDEAIVRRLRKDSDFAAEYLKAALEDEDEPRVLLIALRHLAQAQGIAKVAKAAGIERESLYRALSVHGNPRLSTLVAVTKAIGLRLTVESAP
jgi:probable addiction module antidote protein